MDDNKLNELQMGEDVTVITLGRYQLVDVAAGLKIPPLTEVTLPLSNFVMNHLLQGNLTLAGEEGAPKPEGEATDLEGITYRQDTQAARSKPTEDAFGASNEDYAAIRERRAAQYASGEDAPRHGVATKASGERDEISQGAVAGPEGTSEAEPAPAEGSRRKSARRSDSE